MTYGQSGMKISDWSFSIGAAVFTKTAGFE